MGAIDQKAVGQYPLQLPREVLRGGSMGGLMISAFAVRSTSAIVRMNRLIPIMAIDAAAAI